MSIGKPKEISSYNAVSVNSSRKSIFKNRMMIIIDFAGAHYRLSCIRQSVLLQNIQQTDRN